MIAYGGDGKRRETMKTNEDLYFAQRLGGASEVWDFGTDGCVDYHGIIKIEYGDRKAAAEGADDDTQDANRDPAEAWEIPEDATFAYVTEDDQGFVGVSYLTNAEAEETRKELDARMSEDAETD